jgi:hypothetical protein
MRQRTCAWLRRSSGDVSGGVTVGGRRFQSLTMCNCGRPVARPAFAPSLLICKTWKKHEPTVQGLLAMNLARLNPFV